MMTKRRNILTLATALILVVVFVLYMITFVVRQGQVAVLTTFKKVVRVVQKPGLYWKAPPPIQTVVTFDARLHTDKDRFEETKTSDGVLLVLLAYYTWRVEDPEKFYTKFYTRDEAETLKAARKVLGDVVRDAKDDVFGQYAFADLMPRFRYGEEPTIAAGLAEESPERRVEAEPKFREIEAAILERVKQRARDEYGIEISQVGIMRFELPERTTQLVFRRMQEERERVAAAIRESGKGEREKIQAQADAERDRIIAAATAEAERERALGDKEAAEYYGTFAKNPELHDFLRKLQALKVIVDEGTTLILATDSEPFKLLRELPSQLLHTAPETGSGTQ
jgi:membrane protease subunit HflC